MRSSVRAYVFAAARHRALNTLRGARVRATFAADELTSLEIVLGGGYVKRTKECDHECGPGMLTVEPAGDTHAGIYGPRGWRALLVEIPASRVGRLETMLSRPVCRKADEALKLGQRASVELQRTDPASALVLESIALELMAMALRVEPSRSRRGAPLRWLREVTERLRDEFRCVDEQEMGVGLARQKMGQNILADARDQRVTARRAAS